MKTLYLLRHAKSSWEDFNQTDFARPLNKRGLLAAPQMGKLMYAKKFIPDLIVSSPAERARTTAEIVAASANFKAQICFEERIYEASVNDLFKVLSEIANENNKTLLVGHNPGLEDLIKNLTKEVIEMPTAGLAKIELKIINWKEIYPACGKLCNLFKPKEIAD